MSELFTSFSLAELQLKNRIVMAPLTRCRAIGNRPNDLMVTYYAQRASAGLIITEGTAPDANGIGYANIPGIYSQDQIDGWKKVTDAVHAKGGHIFIQLMHTGRASVVENLPAGAQVLAPSAIKLDGETYAGSAGMLPYPTPEAMNFNDIQAAVKGFVQAAKNAIKAGFDGVELHGANGYLIDQFLNPASNKRADEYGLQRSKFALEVATAVAAAVGGGRTAIRLSPNGIYNGMEMYEGLEEAFIQLAADLGKLNLAYLHVVDHSDSGAPEVPPGLKASMKKTFGGTFIDSGGMNRKKAQNLLDNNAADLFAFGKAFISNPDLVERLQNESPLTPFDTSTFYSPGDKGYIDYPTFK